MKTLNEIIKKIEQLESDFDIFNSRIIEFADTTKKYDIDSDLLEKYIKSLEEYKQLSNKYKNEVRENIKDKDQEEFKAQKEIVIFRLEKLDKLFSNNLAKLKLILNSIKIVSSKKSDISVDFSSTSEMLEINKNLYDFYNNYNENLDFQKKYNINISLEDKFEQKIEKKLNSLELVKTEKKYMSDLNSIFEDIELFDIEFSNTFKELMKYKNNNFDDFNKFENYYLPEKWQNFVLRTFEKIFKKSYEMQNFEVYESFIYKDFNNWLEIVKKHLEYIKFLIRLNKFWFEYQIFLDLNKKYNLFKDLLEFEKVIEIFFDTNNKKFESIEEIIIFINWNKNYQIEKINEIIDFFDDIFYFIKKYDYLYVDKANDLNYWAFESLFSTLLVKESVWEDFFRLWLKNIKEDINKNLEKLSKDINLKSEFIKDYNKKLEEIEKSIINIKKIINWIRYTSTLSLSKKSVLNILIPINWYLLYEANSKELNKITNHINDLIERRYRAAKKEYNRRIRSSWYSSSSFWSSWWWFSSSSGSFSSSYSSSGSSRW